MIKKILTLFCLVLLTAISFSDEVDNPFAKDNKITLRATLIPATKLNENISNNDYMNTGSNAEYDLDYDVNSGIALGAEVELFQLGPLEISIGSNLYLYRGIDRFNGEGLLDGATVTTYDNIKTDAGISNLSFYGKGRLIFGQPQKESINMYLGGTFSYNIINLFVDNEISSGVGPGLGIGVVGGLIIFDTIDLEAAYRKTIGTIDENDGFDDLSGLYTLEEITLSMGYRFSFDDL